MTQAITISNTQSIDGDEIRITATRSSGPGGQNVNKVATKITLRFNVADSPSLSPRQKELIMEKLATMITRKGELVLHEERGRTQGENRKAALRKFRDLIIGALKIPRRRIPTAVSAPARESRLQEKKRDGEKKRQRKKIEPSD